MTTEDKLLKLRKLADAMYYAAQQLTTDASRLHKAMEEYHRFFINEYHKEEPVSDLEEAATSFARKDSEGISNPANFYYTVADKARIFKAGANWQNEQFEKNRLKHCNSITNEQAELEQGFIDQHLDKYNRMPTFLDAIEYGMRLQKEQMMAKAVDVTIAIPYQNGYGGYSQIVDSKVALPFGDNIKVLVIKKK